MFSSVSANVPRKVCSQLKGSYQEVTENGNPSGMSPEGIIPW